MLELDLLQRHYPSIGYGLGKDLEDSWLALWATVAIAKPSNWPLKTTQAVERLREWVLATGRSNGLDWLLPRLKAISKWFRYYSAANSQHPPPKVPPGTLGARMGPSGPYIAFPWLNSFFPWLNGYITRFFRFGKMYKPKWQQQRVLNQLSKFGRGLPAYLSNERRFKVLSEHRRQVSEIPEGFGETQAENFKINFRKWLKTQPKPKHFDVHVSFSKTSAFEKPLVQGGKVELVREWVHDYLDLDLFDVIDETFVNWVFINASALNNITNDMAGFPAIKIEVLDKALTQIKLGKTVKAHQCLWRSRFSPVGEDPNEIFEGLTISKKGEFLLPFLIWKSGLQLGFNTLRPWEKWKFFHYTDCGGNDIVSPFDPRYLYCRVAVVPEPGYKNRVVTIPSLCTSLVGQLARSWYYGWIECNPRSTTSNHWGVWHFNRHRVKPMLAKNAYLAKKCGLQSTDFSTYTDTLWLRLCKAMTECMCESLSVTGFLRNVLDLGWLPRIFVYPEPELETCTQVTGPPMGEGPSYAYGTMFNLFLNDCALTGVDPFEGEVTEDFKILRCLLTQNDDVIAVVTEEVNFRYRQLCCRSGLTLSDGSDFFSYTFGEFCESALYRAGSSLAHLEPMDGLKTRHMSRLNTGLKTKFVDPGLTRASALSRMLAMAYVEEGKTVFKTVVSLHHLIWAPFYNRYPEINPYLPTSVGGLGLPHYKGWSFVWRKRVSSGDKALIKALTMDTLDPKHLVLSSAFSTEPHGLNFERKKDFEILSFLKSSSMALTLNDIVKEARSAFDESFFEGYAGDSGFGWMNRRVFLRSPWFLERFDSWQDFAAEFSRLRAFTSVFEKERLWTRLSPLRYIRRVESAKRWIRENLPVPVLAQKSIFVPQSAFEIDARLNNLADSFFVPKNGELMAILRRSRSTLKVSSHTSGLTFRGERLSPLAGKPDDILIGLLS